MSDAPRRAWQRVTPKNTEQRASRETFRHDAPSPAQEVLAKHDAELEDVDADNDADADNNDAEPDDTSGAGSSVICF